MFSLLGRIRSLSGGKPPADLQTRNLGAPEPDTFLGLPASAPAPRSAFDLNVNASPPLPPDRRILENPSQYITTEDVAIERPGPRKLSPSTRRYSFDSGGRNTSHRTPSKPRQAIPVTQPESDEPGPSGIPLKVLDTNLSPLSPPPVSSGTFGRRSRRPVTAPVDTTPESSSAPSRRGTFELSDSSGPRRRSHRYSKPPCKGGSADSPISPISPSGKTTASAPTPQIGHSPALADMTSDVSQDQNMGSIQSSPTSTIASKHPARTKSRRKYILGSFLHRSVSHVPESSDTRLQTPGTFGYPTPPVPSESQGSYMFPRFASSPTDSFPTRESEGESSGCNTNTESRQTTADTDPINFRTPALFDDRIETFPRRIRARRQDRRGRLKPTLSTPPDSGSAARRHNTWPRVHFEDDADEQRLEGGEVSRSKTIPERSRQERISEGECTTDRSSFDRLRRGHYGRSPKLSRARLGPALFEEQPECDNSEVTSGDAPECECESPESPGADIGPSFSRRVTVSPSISGSPSPSSPEKHSDILSTQPSAFQDAEADTHFAPLARPLSDSRGWTAPQSFDHGGMSRATQNAQLDPDRPGSIVQCPGSPSRSLRPSGATSATSFSSATQHSARSQPSRESSLLSATPTKRSSLSRHASNAGARSRVGPETPIGSPRRLSDKSKGKRKAEDVDITPRDLKKDAGQHTTFLIPEEGRSLRLSDSSHAPSSYHRKRARLSTSSPSPTPSRPSSAQAQNSGAQPAQRYDSWSSRTSAQRGRTVPPSPRAPSRAASARSSLPPASMATAPSTPRHHRTLSQVRQHERPQSQSFSQVSIPISALVSPHAPSIGARSTRYHMHDPRKPPKKLQDTPWTLARPTEDDPGSPRHAWLFFIGFILFPLWWIAAFLPVPQTRTAGDSSVEKAVTIDDPQIERDAKRWRLRCRIMSVVSAVTYIPFIILVAIFARR